MISKFSTLLAHRHNVRAHFWQTLANYTQSAGGMLLGIILARMLEPEVFGKFIMIHASLMFLMIPINFSTSQLLINDAGRNPTLFSRVLGMSLLVSLSKFFILIVFIITSLIIYDQQTAIVSLIIGVPIVFSDILSTIKSDLEGRGAFKPNFLVQIADLATHAILSITLVAKGWGIYGLALGGGASFIPQALIYIIFSRRTSFKPVFGFKAIRDQFKIGFWLWLNQTCEGMIYRVDKIMLGKYSSTQDLGLYNRAYNFAPISQLLLNSLMANATVVGLANCQTRFARNQLFLKTCSIVFLGGVLNWALWWWFSNPLVVWIFGPNWEEAIPVFEAFSFLSLVFGLFYMPSALLLSQSHYKSLAICKLFGLLLLSFLLSIIAMQGDITPLNVSYCFMFTIFASGVGLSICALILCRDKK